MALRWRQRSTDNEFHRPESAAESKREQQLRVLRASGHLSTAEVRDRPDASAIRDTLGGAYPHCRGHSGQRDNSAAPECRWPEPNADAGAQMPDQLLASRRHLPRHLQQCTGSATMMGVKKQMMRYIARTLSMSALGAMLAISIASVQQPDWIFRQRRQYAEWPEAAVVPNPWRRPGRRSLRPYRTTARSGRFRETSRSASRSATLPRRMRNSSLARRRQTTAC